MLKYKVNLSQNVFHVRVGRKAEKQSFYKSISNNISLPRCDFCYGVLTNKRNFIFMLYFSCILIVYYAASFKF